MDKGTFSLKDTTTGEDITTRLISLEWSGDITQAGRRLNFTIAYTTKDKLWKNLDIQLGHSVLLTYTPAPSQSDAKKSEASETKEEDKKNEPINLFQGIVFMRSRNSESYTMEFVAYDLLINFAKAKYTKKFKKITVKSVIEQMVNELGVSMGKTPELSTQVDFIADNQSASQIIEAALKYQTAVDKKKYHYYLDAEKKLNVVDMDELLADYIVTDETNVTTAHYSESAEDMVNRVQIADKDGNIIGTITNPEDLNKFGVMQEIYKVDDKQDTKKAATAMLKKVAYDCSINCVGNIQCIAGYSVTISEEQLKGKFRIKSDSHKIENGQHMMQLNLEFTDTEHTSNTDDKTTAEGSFPSKSSIAKGDVKAGMKAGKQAFIGQSYSPDPANGCAWAATGVASYYSPWAAQQHNQGTYYVPTLVENADANNMVVPYSKSSLSKGDMIVYGDNDHVVVYDGGSKYVGNSSSQGQVVNGKDYLQMGGLYPTKIIKTSQQ